DAAGTVEFPLAVAVNAQRVAVLVPVHAALAAHAQPGPDGGIRLGDLDVDAGVVVHPAEITHDGDGLAAVPLADAAVQFLYKTAVLHFPGAVAVQHVAGFVAAGSQVALGLLGIFKVVGVEVLVPGVGGLAGGIGIQHGTIP